MSEDEWISRVQWERLLKASRDLMCRIEYQRREGRPTGDLWEKLRPINQRIRSDSLKVIGIDNARR